MTDHIPCEFALIRYVPNTVTAEFLNIGVVLCKVDPEGAEKSEWQLRMTRDWTRVQCFDPDADIDLLIDLESEWASVLNTGTADHIQSPLSKIIDSLSNSIQMSDARACLVADLSLEVDRLMRLYVDPMLPKSIQTVQRKQIFVSLHSTFESAGVWSHMQKRIPVSGYTQTKDPMKLDCGYRSNGSLRVFQAVSMTGNLHAAKALAYSARFLFEGVSNKDSCQLDLVAVIESADDLAKGRRDPNDAKDVYDYGLTILAGEGIRTLVTSNLARAAEIARIELHLEPVGQLP